MDKRSYSLVLPAAFLYFVLLGFTAGQFFPGKAICFCHTCALLNPSLMFAVFLCALAVSFFFWSEWAVKCHSGEEAHIGNMKRTCTLVCACFGVKRADACVTLLDVTMIKHP